MNLEASHELPTTNQASISASGNSYWQVEEPKITVTERAVQVATVSHKVVTHKAVIITAAVLAASALAFASYTQISNMRERAYHAELQRTSRVVVL